MKRALAVVFLLVAVMAVQGAPENDEATRIQESECFECHGSEGTNAGKGGGPAMQEVFRLFLSRSVFDGDDATLDRGASVDLTFDIRNWWTAELQGFTGFIDLSEAPAFSFEPAKDPESGSKEGSLPPYEPAEYFQGTPRTARTQIDIPAGGTELQATLTPGDGTEADLLMRVWGPGANPETDAPAYEIDNGGDGAAESLTITEDPVQGGTYIIEAEETPTPTEVSTGSFDAIGYSVDWTLSFDFDAGEPVRTGATLAVLDGQDDTTPQTTTVSWPVNVVQNITDEQRIRVYMETAAYYDHPPQFRAVDEWLYWNEVVYVIAPDSVGNLEVQRVTPDGDLVTEYIVGDEVVEVAGPGETGPDLTEVETLEADILGEVIGYAAAFLLIISLLSGGAFGNWSRRVQQWMMYRRAKRRVAFHNVVSYGLILVAIVHMVLFLVESRYPWTVGFFLGGVSIIGMLLSGVTGLYQRVMVRGMGHEAWRWLHYLSFVLAFAGAAGHILLDGIHFADFQEAVAWQDPVAPALEQIIPVDNTTVPASGP